jgi:tetraacyldisaccharide 4'-kinase
MTDLIKYILFPFSVLYGIITYIRNKLFDFEVLKSVSFDIPIISVGNITVGGTGKTPHIEYLISILKKEFKLAVLSRGYKRRSSGFVLATNDSNASEIGDEPMQVKQKFPEAEVAVMNDRVGGVKLLLNKLPDIQVILLDDAFQHRYIKPGLSILLVDYNRPIFKDHLLPAGRLREPCYSKNRADIIIVTKIPENLNATDQAIFLSKLKPASSQLVFFSSLHYGNFISINSKLNEPLAIQDRKLQNVLLITGIANPEPLKDFLNSQNINFIHLFYPDHYAFESSDIKKIEATFNNMESDSKIILTTEKDAMRLKGMSIHDELKNKIYYIEIQVEFRKDTTQEFNNKIYSYVRKN